MGWLNSIKAFRDSPPLSTPRAPLTHQLAERGVIAGHEAIQNSLPVRQTRNVHLEEGRLQQQIQNVFAPSFTGVLEEKKIGKVKFLLCHANILFELPEHSPGTWTGTPINWSTPRTTECF